MPSLSFLYKRQVWSMRCVARVTISLQRCLQETVVLHGLECSSLPTCIQIKSKIVADAYVVILFLSHTLPQKYFGHLNYI